MYKKNITVFTLKSQKRTADTYTRRWRYKARKSRVQRAG